MDQPIWRCRICRYKTHHRFWKDDKQCPICGLAKGAIPSNHGGLCLEEIRDRREKLRKELEDLEELTKPQAFTLDWLRKQHRVAS